MTEEPAASAKRETNLGVIDRFFALFGRDEDAFLRLWATERSVELPFAPPGFPTKFDTPELFKAFWDRPFSEISGRFDWTIIDRIVGEDPDEIVVVTRSEVNATLAGAPLIYAGNYIQIFRFRDGKIVKFTEYVDTFAMSKIYNF